MSMIDKVRQMNPQARLEWLRIAIVALLMVGYLFDAGPGGRATIVAGLSVAYLAGWALMHNRYPVYAILIDVALITGLVFYSQSPYMAVLYAIPLGALAIRRAVGWILLGTWAVAVFTMWLARPTIGIWPASWAIAGALLAFVIAVDNWTATQSSAVDRVQELEYRLKQQISVTQELALKSAALSQGGLNQAAVRLGKMLDPMEIQVELVSSALELTSANLCLLYLKNEDGQFQLAMNKSAKGETEYIPQMIARSEAEKVTSSGTVLAAPLIGSDGVIGSLRVAEKSYFGGVGGFQGTFWPEDYQVISVLAALGAQAIEMAHAHGELKRMAETDALTKLYNRRKFLQLMEAEIERQKRYGGEFCVAILDIDNFKSFNDTFGHQVGDEVLMTVAHTLKKSIRITDTVARWGGEEFVILMPQTGNAFEVLERARQAVEAVKFPQRQITISLGWAHAPQDGMKPLTLIENADKALYAAKESGKNRVVQYQPGMKGKEQGDRA